MILPVEQRSYRLDAVPTTTNQTSTQQTPLRPVSVALRGRTRLLLEALLTRLDKETGLCACGSVTDPDADPIAAGDAAPDVVIREIESQESPIDIVPKIQNRFPGSRVVLLCSSDEEAESASRVTEFCITVKDSLDHCLAVVRRAAGQNSADNASSADQAEVAEQLLKSLTPRQLQIFSLLASGDSVKEVARALDMSFKAIDSQKYRIMRKLGLSDRVQATRLAIRAGLLNP